MANIITYQVGFFIMCIRIPYMRSKTTDAAKSLGILNEPGDSMTARVTDNNRKVVKVQIENGNTKYSATQYR